MINVLKILPIIGIMVTFNAVADTAGQFTGAAQLSLGGTASESIGEPLVYMPDGVTVKEYDNADWYKVTIPKYGKVTATLTANGHSANANFYPDLGQIPSSSQLLEIRAWEHLATVNSSTGSQYLMPGTYYLAVNGGPGIYSISVSQTAEQQPADNNENDNEFKNAKPIVFNSAYVGNICYYDSKSKRDSSDWFKLTISQEDDITFSLTANGFVAGLELYGDLGLTPSASSLNTLDVRESLAENNTGVLTHKLAPGNYYIDVGRCNSGVYSLLINPKSVFTTNQPPTVGTYQEGRQSCIATPVSCNLYGESALSNAKQIAVQETKLACVNDPKSCGISTVRSASATFDGKNLIIPEINGEPMSAKLDLLGHDPIQFAVSEVKQGDSVILQSKIPVIPDGQYACNAQNSVLTGDTGYASFTRYQSPDSVYYEVTVDLAGTGFESPHPFVNVLTNEVENFIPVTPEYVVKAIGSSEFVRPISTSGDLLIAEQIMLDTSTFIIGLTPIGVAVSIAEYAIAMSNNIGNMRHNPLPPFPDFFNPILKNVSMYDANQISVLGSQIRPEGSSHTKPDAVRFKFKVTENYSRPVIMVQWTKGKIWDSITGLTISNAFLAFTDNESKPFIIATTNNDGGKGKTGYCH